MFNNLVYEKSIIAIKGSSEFPQTQNYVTKLFSSAQPTVQNPKTLLLLEPAFHGFAQKMTEIINQLSKSLPVHFRSVD